LSCKLAGAPLPRAFYNRPAEVVAPALLGKLLVHGPAVARIVETEAYLGFRDRAAHAWRGPTPRTRVLFGAPGHAYVYLVYGMYECLNVVTEAPGSPGCVLLRAIEPLCGVKLPANGPGKLTRAMRITRRHNGADLTRGALTIRRPRSEETFEIAVSPRIGIRHNVDWPLRFFIGGNPHVSR
jgi:DNA-3-methyladenine glycosylase